MSRSNRALCTLCAVEKLSFGFFSFPNGDFLESAHRPPPQPGSDPMGRRHDVAPSPGVGNVRIAIYSREINVALKRKYKERQIRKGVQRNTFDFEFLKKLSCLEPVGGCVRRVVGV